MKVYMNAIQAFVPSKVVETFAAFLEFYYIARRDIITEESLNQLNAALRKFHEARQVFSGTVRAEGPSGFSLPRQHAMVHYHDHIKNFGVPNGLCSSITESKHITAVKRPWRRSNKHAALPQMLKSNERLDKLAAARADFTARGMLVGSCFVEVIKNVFDAADHDPMDEDVSDSDETESDSDETDSDLDETNSDLDKTDSNVSTHVFDTGDNHPDTPCPPSPAPPNNIDNDCGPVESGPLMNEVRLLSKKGKQLMY